jgi:hypothetical protein
MRSPNLISTRFNPVRHLLASDIELLLSFKILWEHYQTGATIATGLAADAFEISNSLISIAANAC